MNEYDFTECRYINNNLRFWFYKDFCKDCYIIKKAYKKLSDNGKIFYRWYLFAHTNIKTNEKNAIWEYLNDYITYSELVKYEKK